MNNTLPHADPETLLRYLDEDLPLAESTAIQSHLDGCEACRYRMQKLAEALDVYGRFHRDILKPSIPPPPLTWPQLALPNPKPRRLRVMPWLAAAAAITIAFLLVRRYEQPPEVRAAELLRKAVAAEHANPRSRVRIHSGSHTVERAARLTGLASAKEDADTSALHQMFDQAGYSWGDSLSVAAFSHWRDALARKQDRVDENSGVFLLTTSSEAGVLSDAALTLRADLHAVACTLRFRSSGETIEMTELPAETAPTPPSPLATVQTAPPAVQTNAASVSDELRVTAALHNIGADLGEPVEVQRTGDAVLVQVTGLDQNRRDQIRAALSGISNVQLRFDEIRAAGAPVPPLTRSNVAPADTVNPMVADLQARLGNGQSASALTDQLIDSTDKASQRAFALRALARRFPGEVTSQLSPSDAETLNVILRDHAKSLAGAVQETRALLKPVLPQVPSPPSDPSAQRWQQLVDDLPVDIETVDRTLNGATDSSAARKAQLAAMLAKLDRQIATLQSMVRP